MGDIRVTQTTVTDPRGKTRTYDIESGYIAAITNHLGQRTAFTRPDGTHLITRIQDHLQRRTDIAYDAKKNVSVMRQYKDPGTWLQEVKTEFTYDLMPGHFNLLTQYKDPLNHVWTFGLSDDGKNVTSVTNPLGKIWQITPNASGQPQTTTDPLTHSVTFGYNSYGLVQSVTDHLNNTTTYTYDPLGRRIAATDPRGYTARFAYDLLNRLTAVANPLGQAVQFAYDPNSNLTSVKDPRGGEIVYTYNNMDQLVTRRDQLLRTETHTYDTQGGGTLVSFRDRKNQETTWDPYDDLNRPTVVRFHNSAGTEVGTLTYGYDAAHRLQTLTDSISGQIRWEYDALNRLLQEITPQGTIAYVPDDANRRTSMLVAGPGQVPVTYDWDQANRLRSITRGGLIATYDYDNANRRRRLTLPNGVFIDYGYDEGNRLTSLIYSNSSSELGRLLYAYDRASNRTLMAGSWARTLLPDVVSGGTYDAANRQLTLGGKTMTYDNNGSLETVTEGDQTTYTWDVRDRLTNIASPSVTASFGYDATNRRTAKTIAGSSTTFLHDGLDIIEEIVGGATANYLRGLGIDEHLARIDDGDGTICYLPGALGNTVALTDSAGVVATSYTYEPFGRASAAGTTSANTFQFTGREDDGTGLYYFRARYYRPDLGRFLQEDPVRSADIDANFYSYAENNPANLVDPLGLISMVPRHGASLGNKGWGGVTEWIEGFNDRFLRYRGDSAGHHNQIVSRCNELRNNIGRLRETCPNDSYSQQLLQVLEKILSYCDKNFPPGSGPAPQTPFEPFPLPPPPNTQQGPQTSWVDKVREWLRDQDISAPKPGDIPWFQYLPFPLPGRPGQVPVRPR